MSKARVKVTVKKGRVGGASLAAHIPIAVTKNANPSGQRLYQTKAQISAHLHHGQRPQTSRFRRAN